MGKEVCAHIQGLGYLFLVSRLGEVSSSCAGLGWLQVWLGCLWGHLRGQSGLCHRWWLAYLAGLLQSRPGEGGSPHWLRLGWSLHSHWFGVGSWFGVGFELHLRWRWFWSEIGVGLEIGVLPRWRCGWSCFGVGFGLFHEGYCWGNLLQFALHLVMLLELAVLLG